MNSEKIPLRLLIQLKIMMREVIKEAFQEYLNSQVNAPNILNDDFLSAKEASKYLKIKLSTLYSKVENGEMKFYRSGKRKLLFSLEDLKEYIKSKK